MQRLDAPEPSGVLVRTLGAILQHARALTGPALTDPDDSSPDLDRPALPGSDLGGPVLPAHDLSGRISGARAHRIDVFVAGPFRDGRVRPAARHPSGRGATAVEVVHRGDLAWGDALFVTTKNSIYCINPAGHEWFVWGGWFERHGHSPAVVGINGCTWGGTVIHSDILAAPGLFLEFSNGVTTTRIRDVLLA